MLARGQDAKKRLYARDESFKPFAGRTMAMIFTKPSARTRVSFETVRPAGAGAAGTAVSGGGQQQQPAGGCMAQRAAQRGAPRQPCTAIEAVVRSRRRPSLQRGRCWQLPAGLLSCWMLRAQLAAGCCL